MKKENNIGVIVLAIVVAGLVIAAAMIMVGLHQTKTERTIILSPESPREVIEIPPPVEEVKVLGRLYPSGAYASSTLYDQFFPSGYKAQFAIDGQISTAWVEGSPGAGIDEWIQVDFRYPLTLTKIGIFPGYGKDRDRFYKNNRLKSARLVFSDGQSQTVVFGNLFETAYFSLPSIKSSFVRIVIDDVYPGSKYDDTCISEIEFFGY